MGRQQNYPKMGIKACKHCGKEAEVMLLRSSHRSTHHFCDDDCRKGLKSRKNATAALVVGRVHKPPKPRDGSCGEVSLAKEKERVTKKKKEIRSEIDNQNSLYWEMLRKQRSRR